MAKTTSMKLWIDSYRNHVLYCSLYIAIVVMSVELVMSKFAAPFALGASSKPAAENWNDWIVKVFLVFIIWLALWNLYAEICFIYKRRGLPAGDSGLPVFGQIIEALSTGPRQFKTRLFEKYGSRVTTNILMRPGIVVVDEQDVQWFLVQERKGNLVPTQLQHVMSVLGEESIVFQSTSTNHRSLRKIFYPSFSPSAVEGYMQKIDDAVIKQLEKWSTQSTTDNADYLPSSEWSILAMKLFFVCAFDHGADDDAALHNLSRIFHTWTRGVVTPIPYALPGTKLYKAHQARKQLIRIMTEMVNKFKAKNPSDSPEACKTMMGRLCYGIDDETGLPLNDKQLVSNILFILFAGHDTTRGSFCAFANYLVEYPQIRGLLKEEVISFSEPLNCEELKNAPLLNAFMAEVWRLVPPLSSHVLKTVKDLDYKGYKIRRNTVVQLDIQAFSIMTGENGRYADPLEFRLDRWLPPDHPLHNPKYCQKGVDYNTPSVKYRAFGMGAHMCLGTHFAKMEARIVLTRLLQNYSIEIENNQLHKVPLLQYNNDFIISKI